jgi:uncharacterized protein with FMN-binding domain
MRRVILAVTGTVAGLVALLSFKTHSAQPAGAALSGPPAQRGTGSTTTGSTTTTTALPAGERAIAGNVANTVYGPVQVQVVVKASKIVKVSILEQPSSTEHDLQIGQFAFPKLIAETLTSQSARIDSVSGATYTSGGYIASLQSALDNGV